MDMKEIIAHLEMSRAAFHGLNAGMGMVITDRDNGNDTVQANPEAVRKLCRREQKRLSALIELLREKEGIPWMSQQEIKDELGIDSSTPVIAVVEEKKWVMPKTCQWCESTNIVSQKDNISIVECCDCHEYFKKELA